jgi:hypothetical protein
MLGENDSEPSENIENKLIDKDGTNRLEMMAVNTPKKSALLTNLGIGAVIQVFEVSTLGQPFEVLKTHMAGK